MVNRLRICFNLQCNLNELNKRSKLGLCFPNLNPLALSPREQLTEYNLYDYTISPYPRTRPRH
eukprot:snap_masked-scaffold_44-processed-gene-0.41-mRNA-1 protein AED:1.00 eAED:1.00 QI:0/0/0/0/1/1/3/0/62